MEQRAFLAIVLSLIVILAYQYWLERQYGSAPSEPPPQQKSAPTPERRAAPPVSVAVPPAAAAPDVRVETDHYVATFASRGARLKSFTLKQYRSAVDEKSPPVEMVSPQAPLPLGVRVDGSGSFDDSATVYAADRRSLALAAGEKGALTFVAETPAGKLTKRYTFEGASYAIGLDVWLEGREERLHVRLTSPPHGPTQDAAFEGFVGLVAGKLERHGGDRLAEGLRLRGEVAWAGFGYTYFLMALLSPNGGEEVVSVERQDQAVVLDLAPQAEASRLSYQLFLGPKDLDVLEAFNLGLERSIDFGYFAVISLPMVHLLRFFHRWTGSYGLDIVLLSFLVKLLTAPLTHKSYVSMKQMQKLQPQMERLKQKYKDDREKLNREIMELYRRNRVNPLGGCLPMLLQFPIFIGLYNALLTPIELRHAPFLWIKDLSRPDWESLAVSVGDWVVGLPVLTLLMGGSMFVQQWMTPSAGDPNQRKIMLMMPLIFTVMFVNFPAGLTIYWLVNNVLSIAQQYITNRMEG
jgi:YidC/Oxa1 family membrane protein insertase